VGIFYARARLIYMSQIDPVHSPVSRSTGRRRKVGRNLSDAALYADILHRFSTKPNARKEMKAIAPEQTSRR